MMALDQIHTETIKRLTAESNHGGRAITKCHFCGKKTSSKFGVHDHCYLAATPDDRKQAYWADMRAREAFFGRGEPGYEAVRDEVLVQTSLGTHRATRIRIQPNSNASN